MNPVDPIERHLFVEGIYRKYGYDFRSYAEASFDRRLSFMLSKLSVPSLLDVLKRVLASEAEFMKVLSELTVTTTEFFRDPLFFKALRDKAIPLLRTYPNINVWVAGCSTGQELVSLSILLKEEGLGSRATIYATDINPSALRTAKAGIFPIGEAQDFTRNYTASGGAAAPSDYYTAEYDLIRIDPALMQDVIFFEHNLVTDDVFQECHLILCRNVMIYFNRESQDRVFDLFHRSLVGRGILGIGSKESLRLSRSRHDFEAIELTQNIFEKKSPSAFSGRVL